MDIAPISSVSEVNVWGFFNSIYKYIFDTLFQEMGCTASR
jgi:hypothetical protein